MMPKYTLTYFAARGRAEVIRLIFAAAGEEFEDVRLTAETWPVVKPRTPFGQVPMLEFDGKVLVQSSAICRYLATEFGLAGSGEFEKAQVDMFVDLVEDLLRPMVQIIYETEETRKQVLQDKYIKESAPKVLSSFESVLEKSESGYLVGDSLTWADLFLMNWLEKPWVGKHVPEDVLNKYQKIKQHTSQVQGLANVQNYLEKRPKTDY